MNHYAVDNAQLWIGDGTTYNGHVIVADGLIKSVNSGRADTSLSRVDLKGRALSPGLIDLMVLGGFGKTIINDDPREIAREYLRLGVTTCQLCCGTLPWNAMRQLAENTRRAMRQNSDDAAEVLGVYLEGPFQHPENAGANSPEYCLPPSPQNIERILKDIGDAFLMINISPGVEGDADAIRTLCEAGKIVSMAHSAAPAERVFECVEAGTSVLGHIWDNNYALIGDSGVQQPTIEQVALTDERVRFIHLICDGAHVHPVMVRLTLRARGIEAICVVTDAVPLAGCSDGEFIGDDGRKFSKINGVGRTAQGNLAGSGLLLPDMLRNFVRFSGLPPHQAIRAFTLNPAASLGLEDRIGLLAPGRRADFCAWDENLKVRRVWKSGREIDNVSDWAEVV